MLAECYRVALWATLTRPQRRRRMDIFARDARYAGRMLLKSPGFTSVAVLALALSTSANAVVFSLIDSVFVRPLNSRETWSRWPIRRSSAAC